MKNNSILRNWAVIFTKFEDELAKMQKENEISEEQNHERLKTLLNEFEQKLIISFQT